MFKIRCGPYETTQEDVSHLQLEAFCFGVQISTVLGTSSLLSQSANQSSTTCCRNWYSFLIGLNWNKGVSPEFSSGPMQPNTLSFSCTSFFFFGLLFLSFLFSLSQFFIYLHVRMCVHNCVCIHAHIIRYVYDTCSIIIKCNCSLLNFFLSCLSSSAPNSSRPTRATQRHCYHRVKLQAAEP